jgi:RHS repeat-associated protein
VSDGTHSATYTYIANSPLVDNIVFKQSTTTRMTTRKQYDKLNRLQQISFTTNSSTAPGGSYTYAYNNANQRTRVTLVDGSYWIYEYDNLGQVTSGKRYWSDGSPVAGQQFEYAFDDIGNRNSTKAGGDANGANLRLATYTPNRLNQYSSRTVPGAVDVLGAANAIASVTVNSVAATARKSEYYHREVSITNSSSPVWQAISVIATEGGSSTTNTGNLFVPKTDENFGFDLDGNTTNDGRWTFTWDGENRLIRMVANTAAGPQQRLDFEYDWKGRRISKKLWNNTAGSGSPAVDQRFQYDDWNLLTIVDSGGAATHSFTWGTDLSGSMQGAGGVGGLISMKMHSGGNAGTYFYSYDGNGNVVSLANAANGSIAATYEYNPFGEVIRATGSVAQTNLFRFSGKFTDEESGLTYYGHRLYRSTVGTWLSRDPIAERGGRNLYGFVLNNPIGHWDPDGRKVQICCRDLDVNMAANCLAKLCGVRHCWIKTDTKAAGMGPADSDDLPMSPCCGTKVKIKDHSKETGATCYDVPRADEDCVNNALEIGNPLGTWSANNQCNSFVADVIRNCGGDRVCLKWTTIIDWETLNEITVCLQWAY